MKNSKFLKSGYPYSGIIEWGLGFVENAVSQVKKSGLMPDFGLRRVELHPTSMCQFRCSFCYGTHFREKHKKDLPLKYIEDNVFESLRKDKIFFQQDPIVILAGLHSEPLAHSDRIGLIRLLGKYNFRFGIYTNGGFLDQETITAICDSAKKSRSQQTSYISFNVIANISHNTFDSLEKKIKLLISTRNKIGAPVQVNVPILVDGSISAKDLKKLHQRLLNMGVDKIRYSVPQIPVSDTKLKQMSRSDINLIKSLCIQDKKSVFVRSISGKPFDTCFVMANTVSIDYRGAVYPCSQTCSRNFQALSYGSVKMKKLSEIWGGQRHQKLFDGFKTIPTYCRCNLSDQQFNSLCTFINES